MSVAYYIVLDSEEPGFETFVNGKAVAHAVETLDALCESAGLSKLDSFVGQSMEDLEDLIDEDVDLPEDLAEQWFDPAEGIALFDALADLVKQNRERFAAADDVLEDLAEYQSVLNQAREIGAQWHLALDF